MVWPCGPPPLHDDYPLVTIVLDLGNSCQCYGCLQKTSRVLNKLSGVREHSYNLDTNQIKLTGTVNPDVVVRKFAKIKKHVKVSAVTHPTTDHVPTLLPSSQIHHGMTHDPPPPHCHSGSCRGCDHVPPPPPLPLGHTQGPTPTTHPPPWHGLSCSHRRCDPPLLAHCGNTQGPPPPSHPPTPHGHSCRSCRQCDHPPTQAQPPRQSVLHTHVAEQGKSPGCHPPFSRHTCVVGPPPPPPTSGFRCPPSQHHHNAACTHGHPPPQPQNNDASTHGHPPPQHNHNAASTHGHPPPQHHHNTAATHAHPPPPQHHHNAAATHAHPPPPPPPNHQVASHHTPNNPADQLGKFLNGPSSPLIPRNVLHTSILSHLAKIPKLKNVELMKKKGIKFRLQDGQIKSYHPINHMEFRPPHDCVALPHHHHQPPRYISPFSDENLNSSCTIM